MLCAEGDDAALALCSYRTLGCVLPSWSFAPYQHIRMSTLELGPAQLLVDGLKTDNSCQRAQAASQQAHMQRCHLPCSWTCIPCLPAGLSSL